jgi:hypothetical protein
MLGLGIEPAHQHGMDALASGERLKPGLGRPQHPSQRSGEPSICYCVDIAKSLQNRQRHAEPVRHPLEPEIRPTHLFGQFDRRIYDPVTEIERRFEQRP